MSTVVSVRFPDTLALDEQAAGAGLTRSEFIRQLVDGYGPGGGCWVVRYYDGKIAAIFPTELEALRCYTRENIGQEVAYMSWGSV